MPVEVTFLEHIRNCRKLFPLRDFLHEGQMMNKEQMMVELGELYKEWTELNCSDTSEINEVLLILK